MVAIMSIRPLRTVIAVLLVMVVGVVGVAIAAHHNPAGFADTGVLNWMLAHRTGGVTSVATVLTDMFSPTWVGIWTVIAAAVLLVHDRTVVRGTALLGTVVAAGLGCELFKLAVNRSRPPRIDQVASPEVAMSFPSGHVTGTAALVFGVAVITTVGSRRVRRVAAISVAVVIVVLAAATRLYLGAHWLSDVTAAIALAAAATLVVPPVTAAVLVAIEPHAPLRWQHVLAPPLSLTSTKG